MARQNINTGSTANDGTGDTLRSAGNKINDNFVEIYRHLGGGDSDNLSAQVSLEDSAVVFEGATADDFEMRLTTVEPSADRQIQLPNADGIVVLKDTTDTLTNKTLTNPLLTDPKIGTTIKDSANEEILIFNKNGSGSGINHIIVQHAISANPVRLEANSTTPNVNFEIHAQGEGTVEIYNLSHESVEMTANGTITKEAAYTIFNKATALAATLDNGFKIGQHKFFTNKGAGTVTVTPTNFANGTSFEIAQNEAAQCIWDGSNWFLIGNQSVVTVA